jgi:hypothetical protein
MLKKYSMVMFAIIVTPKLLSIDLEHPIPENSMNCSQEVEYIYNSDYFDRTKYILDTSNFDIDVFNYRDSIRLKRIIELDKNNCFKDFDTYYKAAFVYLHTGGINMTNDSTYFKRASELFNLASLNTNDSLKIIGSQNLSELAYNYYLKEVDSNKSEKPLIGKIQDINFFSDTTNIDSIRKKMRIEFKKKISEIGFKLSDEQIDQNVEEAIKLMEKQLEAAIRSAKKKAAEKNE